MTATRSTEEIQELAWCGNSLYHFDSEDNIYSVGTYDERCGACRRMFERITAYLADHE